MIRQIMLRLYSAGLRMRGKTYRETAKEILPHYVLDDDNFSDRVFHLLMPMTLEDRLACHDLMRKLVALRDNWMQMETV